MKRAIVRLLWEPATTIRSRESTVTELAKARLANGVVTSPPEPNEGSRLPFGL
jgi:hypothetical protein